jgi:NAD-dependent deacetylase
MNIPRILIDKVRAADGVVVLTGAGISAESGVPTFREAQTGLWSEYDPQELATPSAFVNNPGLVWNWYNWRRELISNSSPNSGHQGLANLEALISGFTLITQNVDGLHHRAGSRKIIELHGNINRARCWENEHSFDSWEDIGDEPPTCSKCGSILRPDVVWFGESLPFQALTLATNASENCDLFFSIGTSALIHPAASLALIAKNNGASIIEINIQTTPLTPEADFFLQGPAGKVLSELETELFDSPTTI